MLIETTDRKPSNNSLFFWATSNSRKLADGVYFKTQLTHSESYFSEFAFDIIALLKGTYNPSVISSFYGFGTTQWEAGSAVDIRYFKPEDVKRYNAEVEAYFKGMTGR